MKVNGEWRNLQFVLSTLYDDELHTKFRYRETNVLGILPVKLIEGLPFERQDEIQG
jgi:hypothetical protein